MPPLLDLVLQAARSELNRQGRRHNREVQLSETGKVDLLFPVNLHGVLAAVLASLSVDLGVDLKELERRAQARAVRSDRKPENRPCSDGVPAQDDEELRRVGLTDMNDPCTKVVETPTGHPNFGRCCLDARPARPNIAQTGAVDSCAVEIQSAQGAPEGPNSSWPIRTL